MGAHKPLMPYQEKTLIDAVIARVAPQVRSLAIDVPRTMVDKYPYSNVLPDLFDEQLGPVCGIITGLTWLDGEWLATFPCDTPFLPLDLVSQLAAAGVPVVVRDMPVCGLWPKSALGELTKRVGKSVRSALAALGGVEVDVAAPPHAFFNVNAPEDLQAAMLLASRADEASRDRR